MSSNSDARDDSREGDHAFGQGCDGGVEMHGNNGSHRNEYGVVQIMDALEKLRAYGCRIARLYFTSRQDIEDAADEGMEKVRLCVVNGRWIGTQSHLKSTYRYAVKCAAIDMLRARYGRSDKEGRIKNPRPQKVEMEKAAFELAVGAAGLSREELDVLVKEWAEVIRKEADDRVAMVFELQAELLLSPA
jgi:hypothetical protein